MPTYPYVSSPGALSKVVQQFRRSLPATVNAGTLKKLAIAPNNESYVMNTLRFLGVVGDDDSSTPEARKVFTQHPDDAFEEAFEGLVRGAYVALFDLHSDSAWTLTKDELIAFFRNDDSSTEIVGGRQATTFATLAALAGHGQAPVQRTSSENGPRAARSSATRGSRKSPPPNKRSGAPQLEMLGDLGLSVRIEINLPTTTDQDVYDKLFRSLRANLIDAQRD